MKNNRILKVITAMALLFTIGVTAFGADYERATFSFFNKENKAQDSAKSTATKSTLVAVNGVITTVKNTAVEGSFSSETDLDRENLTYAIDTPPKYGTLTINDGKSGAFTYQPNTDFVGEDTFKFIVSDIAGTSSVGIITATITETTPTPSPSPTPAPNGFKYADMLGHWGEYSAIKVANKGIVKGFKIGEDYLFKPDEQMTRGEFVMYLISMLNIDTKPYEEVASPFADGDEIPTYLKLYGSAAYDAKIINGVLEGDKIYFRPNEILSRIEAIQMLNNTMKTEADAANDLTFDDKYMVPEWGLQAVKNMLGYGIIHGYADNTIRPFEKLNRAMATEMLWQTIKYKEETPQMMKSIRKALNRQMD